MELTLFILYAFDLKGPHVNDPYELDGFDHLTFCLHELDVLREFIL